MTNHSTPLGRFTRASPQSDGLRAIARAGVCLWLGMIKVALLAMMLASPALAQSQDEVLHAELLPGWRMEDGHRMAALDLRLAPEWKTYWRAPGDTGIPPMFDWTGSVNLKTVRFHWPSPKAITLSGLTSLGYLGELVLPVELVPVDPAKPVTLALKMDLGICREICLPAHLAFSGVLSGQGGADDQIKVALSREPKRLTGVQTSCQVDPIADGLRLTARMVLPVQGEVETVAFETSDPSVWVATSTTHREGPMLISQTDLVPSAGAPYALDRSGLTMTVLADGHGVELQGCPAP